MVVVAFHTCFLPARGEFPSPRFPPKRTHLRVYKPPSRRHHIHPLPRHRHTHPITSLRRPPPSFSLPPLPCLCGHMDLSLVRPKRTTPKESARRGRETSLSGLRTICAIMQNQSTMVLAYPPPSSTLTASRRPLGQK